MKFFLATQKHCGGTLLLCSVKLKQEFIDMFFYLIIRLW